MIGDFGLASFLNLPRSFLARPSSRLFIVHALASRAHQHKYICYTRTKDEVAKSLGNQARGVQLVLCMTTKNQVDNKLALP